MRRSGAWLLALVVACASQGLRAQIIGGTGPNGLPIYQPAVEGEIWQYIGSFGHGDGMNEPGGIAVWETTDPESGEPLYRLYVADRLNHRLVVYDAAGNLTGSLDTFSGLGDAPDTFSYPEFVTVDASGNLLVADSGHARILVFGSDLTYRFEVPLASQAWPGFIGLMPGATISPPPAGCGTPGPAEVAVTTWTPDPTTTETADIGVVVLFDRHLCRVTALGEPNPTAAAPASPGNFADPDQVIFDAEGRIYVADYNTAKVEVFGPDPASPTGYSRLPGLNTGEPGVTAYPLQGPWGLMLDPAGRLAIGETNSQRISVFLPPWHPDNTSGDPDDPSPDTEWQHVFSLVFGGEIADAWPSVMAMDSFGRWLVASPLLNVVHLFQIPELAVFGLKAAELATGDTVRVVGRIAVPFGKVELVKVEPGIAVTYPSGSTAQLGSPSGPYLAPGVDPLSAGYDDAGQAPIASIAAIAPGEYATVYWDFPIVQDGVIRFALTARAPTGLAPPDDAIVAPPKDIEFETIVGACAAPVLNPPAFDPGAAQAPHPVTGQPVFGNDFFVTLSAVEGAAGDGVREIQYRFTQGPLADTASAPLVLPGNAGNVGIHSPFGVSGLWTLRYRAVATCGAASAWADTTFEVDARPPSVTFGTPLPAPSGVDPDGRSWWNATVFMPVSSTDGTFGSDVRFSANVTVSGGTPGLVFDAEGAEQIQWVTAADPVGNAREIASDETAHGGRRIHLDRSAPVLTLAPDRAPNSAGWYNADVVWLARATDALSGVRIITSPDGLSDFTVVSRHEATGRIVESREGASLAVSAAAADWAANTANATSPPIHIDRTPPSAAASPAPGSYAVPLTIVLVGSDALSGVAEIRYRLNGGPEGVYVGPLTIEMAGTVELAYHAVDRAGNIGAVQTASYTVLANRPPIAADDAAETTGTAPVRIDVLANDSDPDGDPLSIASVTQPSGGAVVVNADQTVTFTAAAGFTGTTTFTYTASDGRGGVASATVTVRVGPDTRFRTQTQGGWGGPANSGPGRLLAAHFGGVYGAAGVRIGSTHTLQFTAAAAVRDFLPQGGAPGVLSASAVNPRSSTARVFAGQVLALQLNVDFSRAGVTRLGLEALRVRSGKLAGWRVGDVLALANAVLGGSPGALPSGVSLADLNDIVDRINNNYTDGTVDRGYLIP